MYLAMLGAVVLAMAAYVWFHLDGVLLEKSNHGRAIPNCHGFRRSGAGGCSVARRAFRGIPLRPRRPIDVWVTQVGSGQFHNLTRGSVPELVIPRPYLRLLARRRPGHVLGSKEKRLQ